MLKTARNHEFRKKLIGLGIKIIALTKDLPKTQENNIIANQIIRSSTSIGSNYTESMFALTKPAFIHCLNVCKKETAETFHWLEVLSILNPKSEQTINLISQETESYLKIFISSVKTAQQNK